MRNRCITGSDLALRVVFGVASESKVLVSANSHVDWLKRPLSSLKGFICGGVLFYFGKCGLEKAKADKIAYSYCTTTSTPSEIHKGLLKRFSVLKILVERSKHNKFAQ